MNRRRFGLDPPERGGQLYAMAIDRHDRPEVELDEAGLPPPPPRALYCCLRGIPCGPHCPSHPDQRGPT